MIDWKSIEFTSSLYSPVICERFEGVSVLRGGALQVSREGKGVFSTRDVETLRVLTEGVKPQSMEVEDFLSDYLGSDYEKQLRTYSGEVAEVIEDEEGVTLEVLRLRAALSQSELSRLTGITQPKISNYENGRKNDIKLSTVEKLANALGATVEAVLAAYKLSKRR